MTATHAPGRADARRPTCKADAVIVPIVRTAAKVSENTENTAKLEKNLGDEIRILTDERLKRLDAILGNKEVLADLHDERTNKRLLTKGNILDRETIERISTKNLKRIRFADIARAFADDGAELALEIHQLGSLR